MWFFCGLITLIFFSICSFKKTITSSWKGSNDSTKNGLNYKYCHLSKKLLLGCDTPKNIDFFIKPENKIDKFFKCIGLSEELQIGNKDFDEVIYFATENRVIIETIKQSSKLQQAFLQILNLCKQKGWKLKRLNCSDGTIWLDLKRDDIFKKFNFPIDEIAEIFIPILKNIADEIDAKIALPQRVRDPFLIKAAAILSVSNGCLFYTISFCIAHYFFGFPHLIDLIPLIHNAAIIGMIMVSVMSVITIKLLRRTSRAHLVLINIIFIGFFSFTASAALLMMDINSDYDSSESHFVNVSVKNKRIDHRYHRPGTRYILNLNNNGERYELDVSPSFYSETNVNDILCSEEKKGFIGYRWIKNLNRDNCSY